MIDLDIRTHFTPSPPLAAHALLRPLRSLATWGPALRMKARCCGDDDRSCQRSARLKSPEIGVVGRGEHVTIALRVAIRVQLMILEIPK